MKKADVILGAAVLLIGGGLLAFRFFSASPGDRVEVRVDGELYGTYSLEEETEIEIQGTNTICISGQSVRMTEADCPDHLCIHQGSISSSGEMIVCLPNRVTVQIISEDTPDVDAVVG